MATDPKDREYLKTEDPTLLKDTYTGALISSDISKLKQMIDWKPKYNKLDLIIRSSIDWELKLQNE